MTTTIAFLAKTQGSATIEDQKASVGPDDYVVLAGRRSFNKLGELLARKGVALQPGDRVKVYDLACLAISTNMVIRAMTKLLRAGISIEIVKPGIVVEPGEMGKAHALLDALDAHCRHVHGIKTHPVDTALRGRKSLLAPDQLPSIRTMLDQPGATATTVARELGVARSTLFNYLERYDRDRRVQRHKQTVERHSENAGDDRHVPKRQTS